MNKNVYVFCEFVLCYLSDGYICLGVTSELRLGGARSSASAEAPRRHSTPSPTSYRVGAVIVTADGRQFEGYTHQTSSLNHAEEEAIARAEAAGASLAGATIYSSMEPCSKRASKPESCSALIIRKGFSRVVFALREPDCFVRCTGADDLRAAGIEVTEIGDMGHEVLDVNAHLRVGR